ncbi:MAG TPA: hypothetical protein VME42_11025 [Steroidobacteraceae bacterium]|nr:hypothetical protein [Steroidobacteraceae bacterium]
MLMPDGRAPGRAALAALLWAAAGAVVAAAGPQAAPAGTAQGAQSSMARMAAHMYLTTLRPMRPGDREKADAIVAQAKLAMAPYQDYRRAIADGYKIFLPNVPQPQYHFTKAANGLAARRRFDPAQPTSLLYKKTAGAGYELVGVMYTDRVDASEQEIDERIPLSIARWHQHINFCRAPPGHLAEYFGANAKFGLMGSISTKDACEAAGGSFYPHVLGWMVHVYPYEADPNKVWSTVDDDSGHDNMDHSSMPGMER